MKKLVTLMMLTGVFMLVNLNSFAQDGAESDSTEMVSEDSTAVEVVEEVVEEPAPAIVEDEVEVEQTFHQIVKEKFIEGGWQFMGIVLLCLILGLAVAIERIITLNLATTNTKKLLDKVEGALSSGGVDAAKEICRNTQGPVASIFVQGL
ncbi:MAG: biopolymer transport protein ExbB, partial [Cyclobacteriaceae bacterium]